MNTIMEEKLRQAMDVIKGWNMEETTGSQGELDFGSAHTASTPTAPAVDTKGLCKRLLELIHDHPGINGRELREKVLAEIPSMPESRVASSLSWLYRSKQVSRTQVNLDTTFGSRLSYAYMLPDQKPKAKRGRPRRKNGIQALLPVATPTPAPTPTLTPTPAPTPTRTASPIMIHVGNYALTLREARALYDDLAELFGEK